MPVFFQDLFKKAKETLCVEGATESRAHLNLQSTQGAHLATRLDAVGTASRGSTFRVGYTDGARGFGVWAEQMVRGETRVEAHMTDPLLPVFGDSAAPQRATLEHDGLHLHLTALAAHHTPTAALADLRFAVSGATSAVAYDIVKRTVALSAVKQLLPAHSPVQRYVAARLEVGTSENSVQHADLAFVQACADKFVGLLLTDKFSNINFVYNYTVNRNSAFETTFGADVSLSTSAPALRSAVFGWRTLYLDSQAELKVNVNLDGVVKSRYTTRIGNNLSASVGSSLAASNLSNMSSHKIGFILDFTI